MRDWPRPWVGAMAMGRAVLRVETDMGCVPPALRSKTSGHSSPASPSPSSVTGLVGSVDCFASSDSASSPEPYTPNNGTRRPSGQMSDTSATLQAQEQIIRELTSQLNHYRAGGEEATFREGSFKGGSEHASPYHFRDDAGLPSAATRRPDLTEALHKGVVQGVSALRSLAVRRKKRVGGGDVKLELHRGSTMSVDDSEDSFTSGNEEEETSRTASRNSHQTLREIARLRPSATDMDPELREAILHALQVSLSIISGWEVSSPAGRSMLSAPESACSLALGPVHGAATHPSSLCGVRAL